MRFLVTKIILEIFVFGLLLIHFLSLPKVDWCLTRWRQVSLYPVLLVPLYMLMLNLFRLYLTSVPTNYQNCVQILSMARICPFAWKCVSISEILLLVLAVLPTLAGITHLFLCVKFIYSECYENQFRARKTYRSYPTLSASKFTRILLFLEDFQGIFLTVYFRARFSN